MTTASEWKPGARGPIKKGPSAFGIALWQTGLNLSIFVLTVTLFIGMFANGSGYAESPVLASVFGAICLVIVVDLSLAIAFRRVDRREGAKGYTTLRGDHKDRNEVDPATGYVIRSPGEDFLLPEERRRRRALIGLETDRRSADR
ncbi:hypothetical protein ACFS27_25660 [Promicromonospora vindobonensis]|uniref:Uncharacterized protein n=1 Tax=Promicromonospora vindobonensis TaxID=195748 RepID=A0ABW5W0I3_9MICO